MNTPYNSISAYELEAIMNYRLDYAGFDGIDSNAFADNEYVLREWNSQKGIHLFKLLGEKLLYTEHVKFEKSNDQIYDDFDTIWYNCGDKSVVNFFKAFQAMFSPYSCYRHNSEYENLPNLSDICSDGIGLIDYEHLATNIYDGATLRIPTPDGKTIVIQNGSKVSKALKKIAEAYNLPNYEDFRISHSQIINDRFLEGDLVLSIHPLDYMTMSDNNCGWDSCMSWANGGEYRQGTVEMMNSPCVIVAYLTASNPYYMSNGYHWNNKKWRQLFIVNHDVITGIKGYPYRNDDLTKKVCSILKGLAEKNLGWDHYHSEIIKYNSYASFIFGEDNATCKLTFNTCHMYNDFGTGHFCYISKDAKGEVYTCFSGNEECMICGELGTIEEASVLSCDNCCSSIRCDECGYRTGERYVMIDDNYYCYDCADRIDYMFCECCGNNYRTENMCIIYLRDGDRIVGETHICNDCRHWSLTWRDAPIIIDDCDDFVFDFEDCTTMSQFSAFDIYSIKDYESLKARFHERLEKIKKI